MLKLPARSGPVSIFVGFSVALTDSSQAGKAVEECHDKYIEALCASEEQKLYCQRAQKKVFRGILVVCATVLRRITREDLPFRHKGFDTKGHTRNVQLR